MPVYCAGKWWFILRVVFLSEINSAIVSCGVSQAPLRPPSWKVEPPHLARNDFTKRHFAGGRGAGVRVQVRQDHIGASASSASCGKTSFLVLLLPRDVTPSARRKPIICVSSHFSFSSRSADGVNASAPHTMCHALFMSTCISFGHLPSGSTLSCSSRDSSRGRIT